MVDEDVVRGKLKQVEGKVQDALGNATGSTEDKVAGNVKQVVGKVEEGVGHAKDAVRDTAKTTH